MFGGETRLYRPILEVLPAALSRRVRTMFQPMRSGRPRSADLTRIGMALEVRRGSRGSGLHSPAAVLPLDRPQIGSLWDRVTLQRTPLQLACKVTTASLWNLSPRLKILATRKNSCNVSEKTRGHLRSLKFPYETTSGGSRI